MAKDYMKARLLEGKIAGWKYFGNDYINRVLTGFVKLVDNPERPAFGFDLQSGNIKLPVGTIVDVVVFGYDLKNSTADGYMTPLTQIYPMVNNDGSRWIPNCLYGIRRITNLRGEIWPFAPEYAVYCVHKNTLHRDWLTTEEEFRRAQDLLQTGIAH
ncbi:TPA: hypothetical protein HA249_02235 [Candidatus Woesearchaeota archaeon]|nr:hypothetical protein [Candidatus Woesearchaeota archaeon]